MGGAWSSGRQPTYTLSPSKHPFSNEAARYQRRFLAYASLYSRFDPFLRQMVEKGSEEERLKEVRS